VDSAIFKLKGALRLSVAVIHIFFYILREICYNIAVTTQSIHSRKRGEVS